MTRSRTFSAALLLAGLIAGTVADRPAAHQPVILGQYRVLAADLHTHSSMWSNGMLTPWGLVLEAERQDLDVVAITAHNEVWDAKAGRAFSKWIGGPTVLIGQEVHSVGHHVIAAGIHDVVDFRRPVAVQIDEIHRQGGVAIAAHPVRDFYAGFSDAAVTKLDGTEMCHPAIYFDRKAQSDFEAFAARGSMTPIGSSDFHGWGRIGDCRTYVFATGDDEGAVIDAIRAHRTVVYTPNGKAYGDPALVARAATRPELRAAIDPRPAGVLDWVSRVLGIAGFAGLILGDGIRIRRVRRATGTN